MSADTSASKPDLFKNAVIILLTMIGVFAALITFLQNYASLRSADLVQQSEFRAVNSTGLAFRAGLDAAQGLDALQRRDDYIQRSVRADTKARALRLVGKGDESAGYELDAERWRKAAENVAQSDPLLAEYEQDAALYGETLQRDAYLDNEHQNLLLDQARAWSGKANGYVAILSTLSVALFLSGLSLTISSRVRYLLGLAGAGLAAVCVGWLVLVLFASVPDIPQEAMEKFVDGQIKYNVANAHGEDALEAIADFDAAIELAPDYGRAYFYRSLANTDHALADIHLDPAKAIADGERALELGLTTSPVYGNLGWLYYLKGQYNHALEATEKARALSPDDCYLPFNHGLTLAALKRQTEAEKAYAEEAIPCALKQSEYNRDYWIDVGVLDLQNLQTARPDLAADLEPSVLRLKEALGSVYLFSDPDLIEAARQGKSEAIQALTEPRPTSAQFEPPVFGDSVDSNDNVLNVAGAFPQAVAEVDAQLKFSGLMPGTHWEARWLRNGRQDEVYTYDKWEYGESGSVWVRLYHAGGLNAGDYELDLFVEGHLAASGNFTVREGTLPPMDSHRSNDVGVTIVYPQTWKVTALYDTEVSVIAARDPGHPTFFGVTRWATTTGQDEDVFNLFQYFFDSLQKDFTGFSSDPREPFTFLGGLHGWISYYTYTSSDGTPIRGAVVGAVDQKTQTVYMIVAEANDSEWDGNLDVFNLMLERIEINK